MGGNVHVLMEKPMTTCVEEAQELSKAAACPGKVFMVNNSANFRENAKRAHDFVKADPLPYAANGSQIQDRVPPVPPVGCVGTS